MIISYSLHGTTIALSNSNYSVPMIVSKPGCTVYANLSITPSESDVVLVTNLLHGVEYFLRSY